MNSKKILAVLLIIIGIGLIGIASYINLQVKEGQKKISKVQNNLNKGNAIFNLSPVTKSISQGFKKSIQEKINEGERSVEYYAHIAKKYQVAGIVLLVGGIAIFFFCIKRKKTSKN